MVMTSINKVQFGNLNDKRYYFSDEIVSLPYGHLLLLEVRDYKKSLPKIHMVIEKEKALTAGKQGRCLQRKVENFSQYFCTAYNLLQVELEH